jgi:hypothetical protein
MKVHELTINLPPECTYCKDIKKCKKIEVMNELLEKFKIEITKNAKIKYNKNKVILLGYVGIDECKTMPYWVELKITDKKVGGMTTMIYVPPEEGYVCSELKKEHKISYI